VLAEPKCTVHQPSLSQKTHFYLWFTNQGYFCFRFVSGCATRFSGDKFSL